MNGDFGYSEEKELGNPYDFKLLKRLFPFAKPYKRLFFYSIFFVILITLLELSLPYLTKIAIDRYIVPLSQLKTVEPPVSGEFNKPIKTVRIDIRDPEVASIVSRHQDLFIRNDTFVDFRYDDYLKLDKKERALIHKNDLSGLRLISAIFIGLILLNFGFNFVQILIMEYTGQKIMHDLRIRLYTHIQSLSVSFFSKNPVGRLVTRVTNDVQNMHDLFTSVVMFVFKDMFLLSGISLVLLTIHWQLSLISFIVLPVVLYVSLRFSRQAREAFRMLRIKIAEINTRFSETISGIKVIQLFLREKSNFLNFKRLNHENYLAGVKQVHIFALFMPIIELLGAAALVIVILYGGRGVLRDSMSLGELVAFITYMRMFFRPMRDITEKYNIMQNAMASAERIFLILDTVEKDGDGISSTPLKIPNRKSSAPEKIGEVVFDNVSFEYNPKENVLKKVSLTVRSGEFIAVVGPTGSGKTTLVNLLLRFYDPTDGRISINGRDITTMNIAGLRSKISLVMQDPFLFSSTVGDNISYGSHSMTKAEMDRILNALNLRELVNRLPDGLDTVLTEGGSSISSGERQLVSIARAFARNPDLIILDEATSYVDSETEHKIQQALSKLMADRTSIVVAHRLTTAKKADRIVVLNKGRIIENGPHDHLMQQKGYYFRLQQLQH